MFGVSSLLFVPGSRPDRFAKAKAAGAGLTVIDLEDAVPSAEKVSARDAALSLHDLGEPGWAIRINPVATLAGMADLLALAEAETLPGHLLLPMVEDLRDIEIVRAVLGEGCPALIPLIETPRGLRNALQIARAHGVAALMFGGGDFASELGTKIAWEPLLAARQQLVLACAEAHVALIDVPFISLDDDAGLARECAQASAIGIMAKAAIHPRQVPVIHDAFAPTEAQVSEAREALKAFAEAGERAIRHNGRMLEAPIVKNYRAIIARSTEGKTDA